MLERLYGDCDPKPTCPTMWRTDRGTYVVQGYIVTDPEELATLNLPPGETAVEVPARLLERLHEHTIGSVHAD
ncbi:hypothetical protein [Allonocardiopsis opalescens]|uniref:Uncharacterized protein n=1 Tax=Allonocardiopsis opalescens TaxID=1144618 RepID=A0A2T0Q5X5_9ACTN|nr:hypothetical protein [Allonocardiopsis opalescens]PRX99121.1 hypothetical protein CLV72_104701 [Allonocardiopsis opalescens]